MQFKAKILWVRLKQVILVQKKTTVRAVVTLWVDVVFSVHVNSEEHPFHLSSLWLSMSIEASTEAGHGETQWNEKLTVNVYI